MLSLLDLVTLTTTTSPLYIRMHSIVSTHYLLFSVCRIEELLSVVRPLPLSLSPLVVDLQMGLGIE